MSKLFGAIMAVLMTIGFATACVDFGQSLSYGFSAGTTGASYSESATFNLGTEDMLKMGSVFAFDNSGSMFGQSDIVVASNTGKDSIVSVHQDMYYTKSITNYVDPHMSNSLYVNDGDMHITTFMGSKLTGVQMGMTADVEGANSFQFNGYTTDEAFRPIAQGYLTASNFDGVVSIKDKFTFDRTTQLNSAVFGFNSSL